jgi:hypothetical protein
MAGFTLSRDGPFFSCQLEAQPDHLTPRWLDPFDSPAIDDEPLELANGITQSGVTVYVPDAATGVRSAYTLGASSWRAVRVLHGGGTLDDTAACTRLWRAGIATSRRRRSRTFDEWSTAVSVSRRALAAGYAPIRGLIHPYQLGALRRYYRALIRRGHVRLGDAQCGARYVAHNEPVARYFHHELARAVGELLGRPIKPSYCYFISYQAGAALDRHVDRTQCEYTLAMCIDFSPEPRRETPWPLCLDTDAGTVTVFQALGDALLYQGRRLAHWRDPLAQGCTSTSLLFHYVDATFLGQLS